MGFEYGSEAEQAIHSVRFFFYDNAGFISEGEVYDEGGNSTSNKHVEGEADGNVEYIDHDIVLAIDATTGRKPTSVVTIINPPTDLTRPEELDDFLDLGNLSASRAGNKIQWYIENGNTKYFTMTTTSYYDGDSEAAADSNSDPRRKSGNYYVTEIPSNCWFTTPAAASNATPENMLDIYVERLAVKVTVDIDKESTKLVKGNVDNVYKLTYIPSGKTEAQDVKIIGGTGETDIYESDGTTQKTVYIKLHGWALNAKTQNTYLIKHLDPTWGAKMPSNFVWNDANNFRSYWGKSYNYALEGDSFYIPTKYMSHDSTKRDELEYIPMNDIDTEFGKSEYCNENTNVPEILSTSYLQMCTSALVLAQYVDADGKAFSEPIVRYNNKLYTYNGYIEMVVKSVGIKLSGTDITDDLFEVKSYNDEVSDDVKLNGRVAVQLSSKGETATWYSSANKEMGYKEVNEALRKFNVSSDALGHYEGYMYYSIPIEHLGAQTPVTDLATALEGYFGVVRNHWYKLSIDEITGFGHGIVEPDEPIVPNPVDDSGLYLNAKINILSWKTLSQKVTL
jgi:hypothetical protein